MVDDETPAEEELGLDEPGKEVLKKKAEDLEEAE